jgi:hypothetical protein
MTLYLIRTNTIAEDPVPPRGQITTLAHSLGVYKRKIDLTDQIDGFYGQHRSGWPYALSLMSSLNNPRGTLLDSFIERTFCWHPDGPRAYERPWIGFIHVPPNLPDWFQKEQSNDHIFNTDLWKKSFPFCKGLFTLSAYHRKSLERKLDIPINNLVHPTETPKLKWTRAAFEANREKKIVQVGWWLRRLHTIYRLPTERYRKIFLRVTHADLATLLEHEREILIKEGSFNDTMYRSAETVTHMPNDAYDRLLSENLVIIDLYDSSANNTVIECIVRNTPLLVNPIEPVIEYLGPDYPFYFNSIEEAAAKAADSALIYRTHEYLCDHPIKKKMTARYFLKSFATSPIYESL